MAATRVPELKVYRQKDRHITRSLIYGAFLFLFWLLLSGYFDPLLLGFGFVSVMLTVYLVNRMGILDDESFPIQLLTKSPGFVVFILIEIVKSNIDVLKRVLSRDSQAVTPCMDEYKLTQKTDLGRVIYANSITLTPGTVSVELTKQSVIVHALAKELADGLATGEMAKAIPDEGGKP